MTFTQKIHILLTRIPRGKVTTYAALARAAGSPTAVRAVGSACGRNPDAPKVPCHRVVRSDGSLGGYSAKGGLKAKIALLAKEGVKVTGGRVDLRRYGTRV